MAFVIAGGIGLFGLVASGWYLGITYIKNKFITDSRIIINRLNESRWISEDIELFNLSDADMREPFVFYDPLPIGMLVRSYDSSNKLTYYRANEPDNLMGVR